MNEENKAICKNGYLMTYEKYFRNLYRDWICEVTIETRMGFTRLYKKENNEPGWPDIDDYLKRNIVEAMTIIPDVESKEYTMCFHIGLNRD